MIGLQIDGYLERTGGWTAAADLTSAGHIMTERECDQNNSQKSVTLPDIQASEFDIMYSWGTASYWDLTRNGIPKKRLIVVVAGVPDLLRGQGESVWHASGRADYAVNFYGGGWPECQPFKDQQDWYDITDPQLVLKIVGIPGHVVNVNCASLFPVGTPGLTIHTTIMNHPDVKGAIVNIANAVGKL